MSAGTSEDFSYAHSITVLINNIPVELPVGSINVRAVFGENAVLFHSTGHPVLINEWGFTLESLQHGATYHAHADFHTAMFSEIVKIILQIRSNFLTAVSLTFSVRFSRYETLFSSGGSALTIRFGIADC